MKNLDKYTTKYDWTRCVPVYESTDPVQGDEAGVEGTSNKPIRELAMRTDDLHGRFNLVERWKASLSDADVDGIVNTYNEMRAFFDSVPEGVKLFVELDKKADKASVYGKTETDSKLATVQDTANGKADKGQCWLSDGEARNIGCRYWGESNVWHETGQVGNKVVYAVSAKIVNSYVSDLVIWMANINK